MSEDHEDTARRCLRPIRGALTDDQYCSVLETLKAALQEKFDLGWMAAGGDRPIPTERKTR